MQNIVNFLRGNVRLEVVSPYPERFMNLCAQNHVGFWALERVDAVTIQVTMPISGYRKLLPLFPNLNAEIRQVKRTGAPIFLWRIRKRYALIGGLFLTMTAIWLMSLYIWDIQVVGNDTVPTPVILQALEEAGVHRGTFGPSVNPEVLRNEVLLSLRDVTWITVNINGSRATVIVRERIHRPPMMPQDTPTAVYATRSGLIDQMIIWEGVPLVEMGDTVVIGQDLISGRMESQVSGTRFVRADAAIYALTWYELSMSMPLELTEKAHTGSISTKSIIFFGESRINLFFDSGISYGSYDKIVEHSDFVLPGGIVLPIRLERRIYAEYNPVYTLLPQDRAVEVLQERLLARLETLIGPGGEILDKAFTVQVNRGLVTVRLKAQCREQIAALRRLEEEEMVILPPTEENGEVNTW